MLIVSIIFIGTAAFISDMGVHYPGTQLINTLNNESLSEINATTTELNTLLVEATDSATQYTESDNPFAAAFGYMLGVFNGAVALIKGTIQVPHLIGSMTSALTANLSMFYPAWFGTFATLAIAIMAMLYIFYIMTKVK